MFTLDPAALSHYSYKMFAELVQVHREMGDKITGSYPMNGPKLEDFVILSQGSAGQLKEPAVWVYIDWSEPKQGYGQYAARIGDVIYTAETIDDMLSFVRLPHSAYMA